MISTPRLGRATLAAAIAVVLLSGTGGTAASWLDTATTQGAEIRSGRLDVEPVAQTFAVTRPDGTTTPLGAGPVVIGDTITLTSTVVVRAAGDALAATLTLDDSGLTAVVGGVDLAPWRSVTTTSSLPASGTRGFTVTGDDDGATATATVTWTIPATTDGRPRAADRSNWWGERLQNQLLDPGGLRWTLTQNP